MVDHGCGNPARILTYPQVTGPRVKVKHEILGRSPDADFSCVRGVILLVLGRPGISQSMLDGREGMYSHFARGSIGALLD